MVDPTSFHRYTPPPGGPGDVSKDTGGPKQLNLSDPKSLHARTGEATKEFFATFRNSDALKSLVEQRSQGAQHVIQQIDNDLGPGFSARILSTSHRGPSHGV